ncbi:MAG TPA: hypothetical protein VN962_04305 [Polyangia bacterium]|nr:hypothetical protein [Polyangia bacterium]
MPHYADGTEAKVGDQVVGKLYNTEGKRAGTIVSITPGADSCNAMVQFTEAVAVKDDEPPAPPRMAIFDRRDDGVGAARFRVSHGEQHGSAGPKFVLFECADYCATGELTKVGP